MNKKKEPTSAFVGRMTRRQPRLLRARHVVLSSLMLIVAGICSAQLAEKDPEQQKHSQPDFYQQDKNQRIAQDEQEKFRLRVSIEHAVGDDVPLAFPKRLPANEKAIAAKQRSDSEEMILQGIILVILCFPTGILAFRILAPALFKAFVKKLSPWSGAPQTVTSLTAQVRDEDEAFSEFLPSFQSGPIAPPGSNTADYNGQQEPRDITTEFSNRAARILATQRKLLQDISRTLDDSARHRMLDDLGRELYMFKGEAGAPEFLPAWQLASALEGLLKQLSNKAGNITQSTLRTVTGAVDLLQELCKPGVRTDLLSNPPLRFLAVDDDVISRTAVSLALKKAFNQPDLADSGELALGLAARHAYDAIFLDVQMPGMDGFELCSKIHDIEANKDTPVIFITCMSDFDARAQSILSGGSDLMGKPFLTFEITVKALTFALARRLQSNDKAITDRDVVTSAESLSPDSALVKKSASTPIIPQPASHDSPVWRSPGRTGDTDQLSLAMRNLNTEVATRSDDLPTDDLEQAFLTRVSTHLVALRGLIPKTAETMDETARQEMLADLYLGLHALPPRLDPSKGHPALRLISALEGLVRKLLEDPKHWTSSVLLTIANALDLMDDLCSANVKADFASNPPLQMLVVDDEPVSRRAITCALQMTFGKPESVENGEAALALTLERTFDLIFMDVQMPGMDGFTACSKIRQTHAECSTPVIFVTGKADSQTRVQVAASGGSGLIAKPFLIPEVTVKALTFAFRSRLQKHYFREPAAKIVPSI